MLHAICEQNFKIFAILWVAIVISPLGLTFHLSPCMSKWDTKILTADPRLEDGNWQWDSIIAGLWVVFIMFHCWQQKTNCFDFRLQLHGFWGQMSVCQLCHLRREGSVHRDIGRLPSESSYARRNRVCGTWRVSWRSVCPVLRNSGPAIVHVWHWTGRLRQVELV